MADLEPIEDYIVTQWRNYLPPSIDQDKLNHIEDNMKLNRDTINEIIKKMGLRPLNPTPIENAIYDTSVYDSLVKHQERLNKLETDKLNESDYNAQLGDFSKLEGGSTLVEAINNRLRRDIDDSADHTYTFKKLILNDSLDVKGKATIGSTLSVAGITSSGKVTITSPDGLETTKLKVNDVATFGSTITSTGRISANGGIDIKNGGTATGTFTVDNLIVTGTVTVSGASTFNGNVSVPNSTLSAKNVVGIDSVIAQCNNGGDLQSFNNSMLLGANKSLSHRIWVQGSRPSLGTGDVALISQG